MRDFVINGETMVGLKFGAHASGTVSGFISTSGVELGLAAEKIRVSPNFHHKDIIVNDFGPHVPVEVMWQLADVNVRMTLIHTEKDTLDLAVGESMGGLRSRSFRAGYLAPAGRLLGGGGPLYASGNHFMGLNLASEELGDPWFFPAAYLASPGPIEIPLGTEATAYVLNWRCIPYQYVLISSGTISELQSSNVPLWLRSPFGKVNDGQQHTFLNPIQTFGQ